jgi:hypothetical protein
MFMRALHGQTPATGGIRHEMMFLLHADDSQPEDCGRCQQGRGFACLDN